MTLKRLHPNIYNLPTIASAPCQDQSNVKRSQRIKLESISHISKSHKFMTVIHNE